MTQDMQNCEQCWKDFPIETMTMMSDCWFCASCTEAFQAHFKACQHAFEPHHDEHGDQGQYCPKCNGFVRDEDMSAIGLKY